MPGSRGSVIFMDSTLPSAKKSMSYKRTCFNLLPSRFLSLVLEREIQKQPSVLNCLSTHPYDTSLFFQGPWTRSRRDRKGSGSFWFKKMALLRFWVLFRCVPSSQCTLKHASNESRLFPALLEFQDGQTYSKEFKDEHVPYSREYKVMWFLKTGTLNSKNISCLYSR